MLEDILTHRRYRDAFGVISVTPRVRRAPRLCFTLGRTECRCPSLLGIACAFLAPALALSIFVALPIVFALTYHQRYY